MSKKRPFWQRWIRAWKRGWMAVPGSARWYRGAWVDMMVFDHGFLRVLWRNLHQLHDGVWRSNQPDPRLIGRLSGQGFRSVLNLRGENDYGSYLLEKEACAKHGLELANIRLLSRELPEVWKVREIDRLFATLEKPLLMHCKSGADRAGMASALYLLLHTDVPVAKAKKQLSARYLHFRGSKTGVLDYMLDSYEAVAAETGISFRDWVYTDYDRQALMASYKSNAASSFLVDRILGRE